MADTYYSSSLTGAQIEGVLTGVRNVKGIVKSNGSGDFSAAVIGTDVGAPIAVGSAIPTTALVGVVGQLYFCTGNSYLYICTAATETTFTWMVIKTPTES